MRIRGLNSLLVKLYLPDGHIIRENYSSVNGDVASMFYTLWKALE